MLYEGNIWVGTGGNPACLLPQMANRHGLIAGATGTGKTVSLKVLAEGFSDMGVPVFLADVKGDLSGMVQPGEHSDAIAQRLSQCGVPNFCYQAYPTVFWDVYGEQGHPVRATVSEMGPVLLSRMLGLNDTQAGVMNILFRVADDEGMLLLDIKDLKAMLAYLGEHARDYTLQYGNVSVATIGAIQRAVAVLESQGGDCFFGEPALDIADWLQLDGEGRGVINILAADKLYMNPVMYSTFLLWMLSELYELLPEQGDSDKPRIVFFFDEAHLLFNDCSKSLMDKIEQVVRLIRSKGVGVYFVTQNPADIPMSILGQLGNRIQHALRAYTPIEQKAVRTAAQTFRANPAFNTEEAITTLATGEALVSFLDAEGAPGIVEKATILPPQSSMKNIDAAVRQECIETSMFAGVYDQMIDRESAYELLVAAFDKQQVAPAPAAPVQVQVTTKQPEVQKPQGFMVFNPETGAYEQKQLGTMSPLPQVPTIQVEPQAPAAPVAPVAGVVQQMPVMVYDAATGQYAQQMMPMQLDPATGNYVAVPAQPTAPKTQKELEAERKEAEKAAKEAAKAEKERLAEERRQRSDELREEAAARARKNDSVIGRVANTAISTASREVTRQLTRNIMGLFSTKMKVHTQWGRLALLAAAMIWGSSFFILKDALDGLPVFLLLAVRFSVGFLLLAAIFRRRLLAMSRKAVLHGVICGALLFTAYAFQTFGLRETTPGKNAFLTTVYCVLVPFISSACAVLRRRLRVGGRLRLSSTLVGPEGPPSSGSACARSARCLIGPSPACSRHWRRRDTAPSPWNWLAAILCVIGIGLVSLNESLTMNRGDALTLVCGVFYALHVLAVGRYAREEDAIALTAVQFGAAAACNAAMSLLTERMPASLPSGALLELGYLAVFPTTVAMLLQSVGQRVTPAAPAAILLSLESVFGVLFSVLFAGELVTPRLLLGFALIFIAVIASETRFSFLRRKDGSTWTSRRSSPR